MTRKRAVKLLMSVTMDGYGRTANDLMRVHRKKYPASTNEQILIGVLHALYILALAEDDFRTMQRVSRVFAAISGKEEAVKAC